MAVLGWVSNPEETRGPLLQGVFWSLFVVSTIVISLRMWLRIKFSKLQWDDYCLIFSYLCLFVFTIITQMEVNMGFGRHSLDISFAKLDALTIYGLAGLTVSSLGITIAKISFAITLLNLANDLWRWINWVLWGIVISLLMFTIPVAILPWVQCTPLSKTVVDFIPGKCIDKAPTVKLGVFQAAYSGLMDFLLALIPWKILWNLQMRPVEKVGVGLAMSLGFVAGVMAILRGTEVPKLANQDVSYNGPISILWADIELATTIIAACIPALRKILKERSKMTRSKATWRSVRVSSTQKGTDRARPSPNSSGNRTLVTDENTDDYQLAQFERSDGSTNANHKHTNSKSNKRTSANKWYSVYERDIPQDSDESIILQGHDGDIIKGVVDKIEEKSKLDDPSRNSSSRSSYGDESSRWPGAMPSPGTEAPANWPGPRNHESHEAPSSLLPLPTFPRPLSLPFSLKSSSDRRRSQKLGAVRREAVE